MDSRHEVAASGLPISEIRRALRRGTAEEGLSSRFKNALRKLHGSFMKVRALGGSYANIELSPDLDCLFKRAGIVEPDSNPKGVTRRRQPVHHG
jgi:hypothetical protein